MRFVLRPPDGRSPMRPEQELPAGQSERRVASQSGSCTLLELADVRSLGPYGARSPSRVRLALPLLRLMRAVYRPTAEHTSHQRYTPQEWQSDVATAGTARGRQRTLVTHPRRHCRGVAFDRSKPGGPFVQSRILYICRKFFVRRTSIRGNDRPVCHRCL